MFFWWINSLRASYESHHIDWSIERSSDPSINRLLNLVHCFCHACILQHFFWVVFGFLMLYPSHPRILTSSHCVLSSSFEMIQNFIELQMAATFISGQGSLTKKETPSFRSECLKLWDVKCPSLLPPRLHEPTNSQTCWPQSFGAIGMYRAGGTDQVLPPSRCWHLSREQ